MVFEGFFTENLACFEFMKIFNLTDEICVLTGRKI